MATQRAVDLASHINETVERGNPADFPVVLRPLYYSGGLGSSAGYVAGRLAVVRADTGEAISVVSDRYKLVTHGQLLNQVQAATSKLDLGPVPRGIYVDRHGARMRALFKFPTLAEPIYSTGGDNICPCIKIENSYDTTSRITVHIGAFRFVCTNLSVGGGGIFAGGFMATHAGEIPVEKIAGQLSSYLSDFGKIIETYRRWEAERFDWEQMGIILDSLPTRAKKRIEEGIVQARTNTVFTAYNVATNYATHRMRSANAAFELLEKINRAFQQVFPPSRN